MSHKEKTGRFHQLIEWKMLWKLAASGKKIKYIYIYKNCQSPEKNYKIHKSIAVEMRNSLVCCFKRLRSASIGHGIKSANSREKRKKN